MKRATSIEDAITESLSELKVETLEPNSGEEMSESLKIASYKRAIQIVHKGYHSKEVIERLIEDYPEVFVLIVDSLDKESEPEEIEVGSNGISISSSQLSDIAEILHVEGWIAAIKHLRSLTKCSITDAKDFIDGLKAKGYV